MPGKTLDQLEGVVWGEPTFDSYLVTTERASAELVEEADTDLRQRLAHFLARVRG
jgi:hypothetical protein